MAARVGLSVQAIQGQQNNRVNLNIRKLYLHFVYFDLFDVSGEIGCELGNTNLLRTNWWTFPYGFLCEGPMLETLDYTIRVGSTPTFLYFDLYLYSQYSDLRSTLRLFPSIV